MSRVFSLLPGVLFLVASALPVAAQSVGSSTRSPTGLDLPVNSAVGTDEETAPEPVPLFGRTYEVDSVVFLVGYAGLGGLEATKAQLLTAVQELSPSTPFAVVCLESTIRSFPSEPTLVHATGANKVAAARFIRSMMPVQTGEDLTNGFRTSLGRAKAATGKRRLVIYLGEARPAGSVSSMKSLIQSVEGMNDEGGYEIHTIALGSYGPCQIAFLQTVAISNHGTCNELGTRRTSD